ncbi:hypothetical protein ACBO_18730 [Acinetobacter bouvetii]|nr:hypothetical protein ACBO_18730 [Acinetobacter bouvetii]
MLSIIACQPSLSASTSGRVDAEDYDAFWIWGNISSAPYLKAAKEIYVLQGEIRLDSQTHHSKLIPQGVSVLTIPQQKVWLVFRNYHLDWQGQELTQILNRIQQWEKKGNHLQGILIDFDAKTQNLHAYALFLAQLRQQLPAKYKLSITGLMDWSNMQDAKTLLLFRNNINEMIIQTYQGSTTIPNYEAYLHKISKLKLPYKIGVVQRGEWNPVLNFSADPNFKGYVVFLLRNPSTP